MSHSKFNEDSISLSQSESFGNEQPGLSKKKHKKKGGVGKFLRRVGSEFGLLEYVEEPEERDIPPFHTYSIEDIVEYFASDVENGISEADAAQRLQKNGKNELKGDPGVKAWKILLHHIFDWMQFVLFTAAMLAMAVGDYTDMCVILGIILLNIVIGFMQEYKSEKTMESLKKLTQSTSQVVRDGNTVEIPSINIVVGDLVILKEGDFVPADIRISYIAGDSLEIDEAVLTGESVPVQKVTSVVPTLDTPVGDRLNLAFKGTSVVKGKARGVCVAVGMETYMGGIATMLNDAKKKEPKLAKAMKVMGIVMVIGAAASIGLVMLAAFVWKTFPVFPTGLQVGVSVAIALVPESLLPIMTLTMAFGMTKMATKNAIVRKLSALESLGNVTNICSDKTGTISCGKMTATDMYIAGEVYSVTGTGISPHGDILDENGNPFHANALHPALKKAIAVCAMCNMSSVKRKEDGPEDIPKAQKVQSTKNKQRKRRGAKSRTLEDGEWVATGMPTEIALQILAMKVNMSRTQLKQEYNELIREFQFDSTTKKMTTVYKRNEHDDVAFVFAKGAPERIVSQCTNYYADADGNIDPIDDKVLRKVRKNQELMAKRGLRVLALAYRELRGYEGLEVSKDRHEIESNLTLVGLVGISDPPRPEVTAAIEICHKAGITVHMVTGDHYTTAAAIARYVGILRTDEEQEKLVMTATEFDKLTDEDLKKMKYLPLVIARCSPDTKVKMVKELHNRRKIVAMTGDGVNDAPAIKSSDVGVAMGKGGSDVTKQAADIILTDDNFATIVTAITEGRRIFTAIRRFIIHFLSGNVMEAIILIVSVLMGTELPLNSTQILWLNCITSTPCAIALGRDKVGDEIMDKQKRRPGEKMFSVEVILDILVMGGFMGVADLLFFIYLTFYPPEAFLEIKARSEKEFLMARQGACFMLSTVSYILHAYNCRDLRAAFFDNAFYQSRLLHFTIGLSCLTTAAVLYIPWVNTHVFHHLPLQLEFWVYIIVICLAFLACCEMWKGAKRIFFYVKDQIRPPKFDDEIVFDDDEEDEEEWGDENVHFEGAQTLDESTQH